MSFSSSGLRETLHSSLLNFTTLGNNSQRTKKNSSEGSTIFFLLESKVTELFGVSQKQSHRGLAEVYDNSLHFHSAIWIY